MTATELEFYDADYNWYRIKLLGSEVQLNDSPIAQGVTNFALTYIDMNGLPTTDPMYLDGIQIDLTSIPVNPPIAVQPGDTWHFQCWYRDSNPGQTSNFTDAVRVMFL